MQLNLDIIWIYSLPFYTLFYNWTEDFLSLHVINLSSPWTRLDNVCWAQLKPQAAHEKLT